MKKIFLCAIAVFTLLLNACGEDKYEKADILIFTQQGCPHCSKAMDFINKRLKVKNPNLNVVEVDVSYDKENIILMQRYLSKYKYKGNSVGTPIIIFNQQMVMGWGLENKVKLQKAFEFNIK